MNRIHFFCIVDVLLRGCYVINMKTILGTTRNLTLGNLRLDHFLFTRKPENRKGILKVFFEILRSIFKFKYYYYAHGGKQSLFWFCVKERTTKNSKPIINYILVFNLR